MLYLKTILPLIPTCSYKEADIYCTTALSLSKTLNFLPTDVHF